MTNGTDEHWLQNPALRHITKCSVKTKVTGCTVFCRIKTLSKLLGADKEELQRVLRSWPNLLARDQLVMKRNMEAIAIELDISEEDVRKVREGRYRSATETHFVQCNQLHIRAQVWPLFLADLDSSMAVDGYSIPQINWCLCLEAMPGSSPSLN